MAENGLDDGTKSYGQLFFSFIDYWIDLKSVRGNFNSVIPSLDSLYPLDLR